MPLLTLLLICMSPLAWAEQNFSAMLDSLPPPQFVNNGKPLQIRFVRLSDNPWQMGIVQVVEVDAPVEKLIATLDQVERYGEIFKDVRKSERRRATSADEYSLYTETYIPVPLVSNDKTTMRYKLKREKTRVLYRFSLEESNNLRRFEGLAGAEKRDANRSVYWEIDLMEPGFGATRVIPAKKFWKESGLGSAQSDWAVKLRSEQPARAGAEILAESEKYADAQEEEVSKAFAAAQSWEDFLASIQPPAPSKEANPKSPSGPAPSTAKPKATGPKSDPKP